MWLRWSGDHNSAHSVERSLSRASLVAADLDTSGHGNSDTDAVYVQPPPGLLQEGAVVLVRGVT